MKPRSNLHTHTIFCDGGATAEEMVLAAIDKGFVSLGFSGHAPMTVENQWCMTAASEILYQTEVLRLKELYKDRIDIVLGLEHDLLAMDSPFPYAYTLGTLHTLPSPFDGGFYPLDYTPEDTAIAIENGFCGEPLKLAQTYYSLLVDYIQRTKPTVIGHFDLFLKFNDRGCFWREEDKAFQNLALEALHALLPLGLVFEVNTGAVARGYRSTVYPAPYLLKELAQNKAPITITSDAHATRLLDFGIAEAGEMLQSLGYKEQYYITSTGFKAQGLEE